MFANSTWRSGLRARKSSHLFGALRDERGFTESSLVLIPTIVLFLCLIQICASVLNRTTELNLIQGETSRVALFGQSSTPVSGSNLASGRTVVTSRKPMPGGGYLIVRSSSRKSPGLTPLLPQGDNFETIGISIDENN